MLKPVASSRVRRLNGAGRLGDSLVLIGLRREVDGQSARSADRGGSLARRGNRSPGRLAGPAVLVRAVLVVLPVREEDERRPDRHGVAEGHLDRSHDAVARGLDVGHGLVRLELDERLALRHPGARLDMDRADRALGDLEPHLRHDHRRDHNPPPTVR
ncbi:MAG: hypothetical protein AVDCRST_MAG13-3313 [uncultured Solirubrobacteraceae bacterium]|uniref:Uncharacterized protein n=1 Tax=uncultured Solirubrobacteraceae bacterium TaxID=1162706 RepID=A0A6J4TDL3_9ACTN|nr:MAG: hypothetical protein AVDCRST_MAG13-3313 [uncultured Solirubrobacteraceae bacterium]